MTAVDSIHRIIAHCLTLSKCMTPQCHVQAVCACTYRVTCICMVSQYLKSTVPFLPEGAVHFVVMLWKSIFAELLWAMVDSISLVAPVKEQLRVCWLPFCGVKVPRSMWSSPGMWAITRNPRNVLLEPFTVTMYNEKWCKDHRYLISYRYYNHISHINPWGLNFIVRMQSWMLYPPTPPQATYGS